MQTLAAISDRVHLWSPVLVKEMRTRMRGSRPAWLQAVYVFIMLVVIGFAYVGMTDFGRNAGAGAGMRPGQGFQMGLDLFYVLLISQAVLTALVIPGLTASSISSEQEQKTYEMLAVTRLRSRQVVIGKLLSAWMFAALLLTTSLPLAAICFLFGGVSPAEIIWSYVILALVALFMAAIGLWCSALVSRSLLAVVAAYVMSGGYVIIGLTTVAAASFRGHGTPILASLSPLTVPQYAGASAPVFGVEVPTSAVAAVLLALAAALCAAAASQRLPLMGLRRGIIVRTLALVLFTATVLILVGNDFEVLRRAHASPDLRREAGGLFALLLLLFMALPAVFAAGEVEPRAQGRFGAWLTQGFSPRSLLRPQVNSAFPFLLLMVCAGAGAIALGLAFFAPGTGHLWAGPFWLCVGLAAATTFGLSMIGMWLALALPGIRGRVLLIAAVVVLYLISLAYAAGSVSSGDDSLLMYLNPMIVAYSIVDSPSALKVHAPVTHAAMLSVGFYIGLGLIGLIGAASAFRRIAATPEVASNGADRPA